MAEQIILSNRYRLEEQKGAGGMAMVYRARDLMLERTVAIKTLHPRFSNDQEFRERFKQEAKSAANLSHPNIVTIHDFGLDAEQLYIVMEYVPGIDLKTLLQQKGHFNFNEAIDLISQACAGVGYAHRAGVIHCDLKPQNLLVTPDQRLKVLDFGIARALSTIRPDEKSDIVWGSPYYFSPEQASGNAPSPASDVYSLGVVLFEMLTGQLPFRAKTSEELAHLHRKAVPPSPRIYNPEIPISMERIIQKTLEKEPADRYRTAGQLGRIINTTSQELFDPGSTNYGMSTTIPSVLETSVTISNSTVSKTKNKTRLVDDNVYPSTGENFTDSQDIFFGFDWITWTLGLLAILALGGLIPFWLWVYYVINPP